jgi:hypothetical protein
MQKKECVSFFSFFPFIFLISSSQKDSEKKLTHSFFLLSFHSSDQLSDQLVTKGL